MHKLTKNATQELIVLKLKDKFWAKYTNFLIFSFVCCYISYKFSNTTKTLSKKVLNVTHDRFGRRSPSHPLTTKASVKEEELVG